VRVFTKASGWERPPEHLPRHAEHLPSSSTCPSGSGGSNTGPSSTRALRAHACLPHWMSPRAPGLFTVHTDPLLKPWVWCRRLLESGGSGRAAAGHLPPGLAPRASLHEFSESGVGVGEGVPALGRACSPTALCSAAGLWCPSTPAAPGTGVGAGGQRDGSRYCGFKGPKPTSDLISELVCWCSKERSYLHDG
jgi:hypothetical protein